MGFLLRNFDIYIDMKDKLLPKQHFPAMVGFTSLLIALCAAGLSVYGLMLLFGGTLYAAVMFGSAELGKLIATTFLYRYWKGMNKLLKTYMTIAVFVLMLVTSAGIFGFLGSAYKKSSLEFNLSQSEIQLIEEQKVYHLTSISNITERINVLNDVRKTQEDRLSAAQTNTFLARNPIQLQQLQQQTTDAIAEANNEIKERNEEVKSERGEIQKLDQKIADLKIGSVEKKDIQTLQYIAEQLGWSLDRVAFWFMVTIIFVFDPLAIALLLAWNSLIFRKDEDTYGVEKKSIDTIQESQ